MDKQLRNKKCFLDKTFSINSVEQTLKDYLLGFVRQNATTDRHTDTWTPRKNTPPLQQNNA